MSVIAFSVASAACAALCGFSENASAQLPVDRSQIMYIRHDASDPDSDVRYEIELFLTADEIDGDSVGWDITSSTLREFDEFGTTITKWTDSAVTISTNDGLWWIDHADAQAPVSAEFIEPPLIYGTGQSGDPNAPDLDYDLEGFEYTAPPGGPPWTLTGSLTYSMTEEGETQAEEDEDEEPIEYEELPPN